MMTQVRAAVIKRCLCRFVVVANGVREGGWFLCRFVLVEDDENWAGHGAGVVAEKMVLLWSVVVEVALQLRTEMVAHGAVVFQQDGGEDWRWWRYCSVNEEVQWCWWWQPWMAMNGGRRWSKSLLPAMVTTRVWGKLGFLFWDEDDDVAAFHWTTC